MRICFIQEEKSLVITGGAVTIWILIKELVKGGHEVCLISTPIASSLIPLYPSGVNICQVIESDVEPAATGSVLKRLYQVFRSRHKVFNIILDFEPNVICAWTEFTGILSLWIKYKTKVPVLFFKMQSTFETWHLLAPFPRGGILKFLEINFLRMPFDAFMGNRKAYEVFKKFNIKLNKAFFRVAVPGIDADQFQYDSSNFSRRKSLGLEGKKVILCVGALTKVKGIEYAVSAMISLIREGDYHLLLIGTGEEEIKLKRTVIDNNLENHVTFLGQKPYNEIPEYIIASDVVLAPSLTELFGTRLMYDAWAFKKPVVVTAVGDVSEIARDYQTALFISPGNPDAIAEKITELFSDPELRNRLVENGYQEAQKYTSDILADTFLEVCENIITRRCIP